jgi:hypothetical protein
MTPEQKQKIFSTKGQALKLTYKKPLKTLKNFNHLKIEKVTEITCRAGIDYGHTNAFRARSRSSERQDSQDATKASQSANMEPQSLPYGNWKEFPYIIEHKDKNYFRFYKMPNEHRREIYLIDGQQEVDLGHIEVMVRAGQIGNSDHDVFNVMEENILDVE